MNINITELVSVLVSVLVANIVSLVTIIGFFVSFSNNRRSIAQTLDGSSEWRKKLFTACSKEKIDMSDVHLLRTSLRYVKYKDKMKIYSFNWFSNESIRFCNSLIAKSCFIKNIELEYEEQEIVRSIIRCLLKNHWEYRSGFYILKGRYNAKQTKVVEDTTKYISRFTQEYFITEEKGKNDNFKITFPDTDKNKDNEDKINDFLKKLEEID